MRTPGSIGPATRHPPLRKEPLLTQIASFADLFVWLLVLKSFLLPLFIIPTGSMAETLMGEHTVHVCRNCGREYPVNVQNRTLPAVMQCPNCRWLESTQAPMPAGRPAIRAGDRIVVHGWPYDLGGPLRPRRWDVVVFKNPNDPQVNYIKRLVGLPGEKVEIIHGDVFIDDVIAPKTRHAQEALWFPYYDHDLLAPAAAQPGGYRPRWVELGEGSAWAGLQTRVLRFDGPEAPRGEIQFATDPHDGRLPGQIVDIYGYNPPLVYPGGRLMQDLQAVNDVRVSALVELDSGDGYVELSLTRHLSRFIARLYADGRVTLDCQPVENPSGVQRWDERRLRLDGPVRLALGHADYCVVVQVGRMATLRSPPEYTVTPEQARQIGAAGGFTAVRIAAERVRATLRHVRIDRDVYYTSHDPNPDPSSRRLGQGVQGRPLRLGPREYFVLGDNSPNSLDARWWDRPGPHLKQAYARGEYHLGTVPADQMIGHAFLVYWPGFLPLTPRGPSILPDLGRVRWIH